MKKRILIFSTAYLPLIGGAEIAVKEITDRLGNDFEFELVTARIKSSLQKTEKIGNVLVHRVGWGVPFLDKLYLALCGGAGLGRNLHRNKPFDAAWAIMASYGGFACQSFCKKTNIPYLLTLQEGDPLEQIEHKVRFVKNWFKQIFTGAKAVQAISHFLADWARRMGATGMVSVVPNGVDIAKFPIPEEKNKNQIRDEVRSKLGVSPDAKLILTVSRLVEKNGIEYLVRSLPDVGSAHLLIVGGGSLETQLKNITNELALHSRVHFLGEVDNEKLSPYLIASDVFCRPSISEGLGNSFLEAMSMGLPVIATPVGGIPDFLEDGVTGWFCKERNAKSIAEKINFVLDAKNEMRVRSVVANAFEMLKQKYVWPSITPKMKSILDSVCASS